MPGRNGYEVAQFVKQSPRLAHIPVVLLTGAFEPADQDRIAASGCDGVLGEPFEPHEVITRVKELLGRASGRQHLDAYFDRGSIFPPLGFKAADIKRANVILIGHGHVDHMSDAASVAIRTGAVVVGGLAALCGRRTGVS
jgi:DNA-binding response OmpR family regulator